MSGTFAEIVQELERLDADIAAAEEDLQALEVGGATDAKGIAAHAKLSSKLAILRARKVALETARPEAELEAMRQEICDAKADWDACAKALKAEEEKMHEILDPLLMYPAEGVQNSLPVVKAVAALRGAAGKHLKLTRLARNFCHEHGLKY